MKVNMPLTMRLPTEIPDAAQVEADIKQLSKGKPIELPEAVEASDKEVALRVVSNDSVIF